MAYFASITQKEMASTIELAKQLRTIGADQGMILPPKEVAIKKQTTAKTTVIAPA